MASQFDVDIIIDKLLEVRGARPGKQVTLTEKEITNLCVKAREVFMSQPMLLELEAPIKICGPPARYIAHRRPRVSRGGVGAGWVGRVLSVTARGLLWP